MSSLTRTILRAMTPEARADLGYPPLTRTYRKAKIRWFRLTVTKRHKANYVARRARRT